MHLSPETISVLASACSPARLTSGQEARIELFEGMRLPGGRVCSLLAAGNSFLGDPDASSPPPLLTICSLGTDGPARKTLGAVWPDWVMSQQFPRSDL